MYLKKLHITNFRCFSDYTIEFAPGVTVLFGKNGTGKSTLIHAIHKALGMLMYTKNEYQNVVVKGKRKKKLVGYKTITNNNQYLHTKGFSNDDFNNLQDAFIEVEATADFGVALTDVRWKMSAKAGNSRFRTTEFEEAFLAFYEWQAGNGQLPLLSYISDSFPHKEDNKKRKIKAKIRALRNFAYFDWDEEEGCTNEWIERLENNLKRQVALVAKGMNGNFTTAELQDADREEFSTLRMESEAINSCFLRFSDNQAFDTSIKFARFALGTEKQNEGQLCIQTTQGCEYAFRKLPAGYKRLFNIVLDIAYRSYILSEGVSTNIPGLVVIDEIDLHLHPALEQVVLQCFYNTFPQIQFIVSTHSPLVLTGIETENKPNVILHMTSDTSCPDITHDIYGIDYNTGIEDVMGVASKNVDLDYMINLCAYMRKRGKTQQAQNIMTRILDKYSKNREQVEKMVEAKEAEL